MGSIRTNAAAAMLGVSPNTLRSWERRFGFPEPRRTAGGHRQFELTEIEALRSAFEETHNISSAISWARAPRRPPGRRRTFPPSPREADAGGGVRLRARRRRRDPPAYLPIVERRKGDAWGDRERRWQTLRRGRYVEFNLLYDRGTVFGLRTDGRVESITVAPPEVRWEYGFAPEPAPRSRSLAAISRAHGFRRAPLPNPLPASRGEGTGSFSTNAASAAAAGRARAPARQGARCAVSP